MRTILAVSLTSVAILLAACSKPNGEASASGEVTSGAAMRLEMGGQLVNAGENKVELRVFADGHLEALVLDARGKAIAEPEKAKLTAHVTAKGTPSAKTAIDCTYDPVVARFVGKPAGKIELEAAPIDVDLKIGEAASAQGKLESPVLLVGPEIGGTLAVAGKYGVELAPHADGSVEAVVHDAAGARVEGDGKVKLEASLAANGGATTKVAFAWDPPRARFLGKADASAKLTGGAAEIAIDGAVAAKLPRVAVRAEAAHGGRVVVAGDYSVELVGKGDVVNAFVFDASGAAVAKADLDLSLRLANGAFVKLVWDAPNLAYRAAVDAKIDFATAPIVVAIKADGNAKAFVGASLPTVDANANANAKMAANANANADAKPDAKLDAKAKADAKIDPKAKLDAKAKIAPPKVDVKPVSVNKSASASAGTGAGGNGGANAKAGFSFGTK